MERSSHVILVTPPQKIHVTAGEHLGIGYLAAGLRMNGYSVEIIDGWLEDLSPQAIATRILKGEMPLCVGFSAYPSNMQAAVEVVRILLEYRAHFPFVAGGYGPTFYPDDFLASGFNFVVRGEGDEVFPQLCEYLRKGTPDISTLGGVSYKNQNDVACHNPPGSPIVDLDFLPFPARDTIELTIHQNNPVNILSSKGCLGRCAFCSIQSFQHLADGPKWRQRSIKNFVDEIEKLASLYGVSHFKVVDDSIIEPPRDAAWCRELADELENRKLKVRLRGSIRANRVTDELIKELRRAGFFCCACGIENFSPTALKRMGKGSSLEQNLQALEVFKKHDIYVDSGSILFDDRTTLEELRQNYHFMLKYIWTINKVFTEMYAAQGTPFTRRLERDGLISEDSCLLGNYLYPILDSQALIVYQALKAWSLRHIHIYDLATNPLRAFRAIEEGELRLFHSLFIELKKKELSVFGFILDMVEDGMFLNEVNRELSNYLAENHEWYHDVEYRLRKAYKISDLVYEENENPFYSS